MSKKTDKKKVVPLYPLRKDKEFIPSTYRAGFENILGLAMNRELPEYFLEERDMLGLEEILAAWKNEKAQKDIQKLAKELGLDKKVGFDWEKKKIKY
ncbi:MAG: hypothetical protein ACFE7E_00575 [Candidatus Hodarchaeota archaeon]